MEIKYINSYTYIETDFKNGLDNIGSVLSMLYPNQTIQDLVDAVYNYVVTTYMTGDEPNPLQARSLKSAIYAIINGYINIGNGDTLELNSLQSSFALELISGTLELRNPEDIKQHVINIEERVTASPLSVNEQAPLLYATAIGKAAYDYWANVIVNTAIKERYNKKEVLLLKYTGILIFIKKDKMTSAHNVSGYSLGDIRKIVSC